MTIWRMRIACWIPNSTNTHSECATHSFSTTTMVARTRLNVRFYAHCLSRCIRSAAAAPHRRLPDNHRRASQVSSCCRQHTSCSSVPTWNEAVEAIHLTFQPNNHKGMNRHFWSPREQLAISDWWSPLRVLFFFERQAIVPTWPSSVKRVRRCSVYCMAALAETVSGCWMVQGRLHV
jgi:hypothetical protein